MRGGFSSNKNKNRVAAYSETVLCFGMLRFVILGRGRSRRCQISEGFRARNCSLFGTNVCWAEPEVLIPSGFGQ